MVLFFAKVIFDGQLSEKNVLPGYNFNACKDNPLTEVILVITRSTCLNRESLN